MSITSDVKGYADAAVEQGKQVVDLAQARLAKSASAVAGKADELVNDLKKTDPRVARALDEAESVAAAVVETMKEKVVEPALTLLGRRPAAPSRKTPRPPTKAAPKRTTTPKPAAAKTAPARKSAATKAPATKGRATKSAAAKRTPAKPTQS